MDFRESGHGVVDVLVSVRDSLLCILFGWCNVNIVYLSLGRIRGSAYCIFRLRNCKTLKVCKRILLAFEIILLKIVLFLLLLVYYLLNRLKKVFKIRGVTTWYQSTRFEYLGTVGRQLVSLGLCCIEHFFVYLCLALHVIWYVLRSFLRMLDVRGFVNEGW